MTPASRDFKVPLVCLAPPTMTSTGPGTTKKQETKRDAKKNHDSEATKRSPEEEKEWHNLKTKPQPPNCGDDPHPSRSQTRTLTLSIGSPETLPRTKPTLPAAMPWAINDQGDTALAIPALACPPPILQGQGQQADVDKPKTDG